MVRTSVTLAGRRVLIWSDCVSTSSMRSQGAHALPNEVCLLMNVVEAGILACLEFEFESLQLRPAL